MRKLLLVLFIIGLGLKLSAQNNFVSNQVIIMLQGKYQPESIIRNLNTDFNLQIEINRTLSNRAHIYLLEFDSNTTSVADVITLLKRDERIAFVQHNHTNVTKRNTIPNDLEYPVQWSLNTSATARIYAPQAWDISTDNVTSTGDTIVLAIVDGGVDIQHIDLNMFKNKHEIPNNGIDDDDNGYVDDYDGWNAYSQSGVITSDSHGTHVAGISGAKTNNSEGIAGIVWGAKIMPINASSGLESVVIEGYGYALEMRSKYNESNGDSGAFVVATNSSFGVDFGQPANFPIWCAFYDSLGAAGVLNMAATSNQGLDIDAVGDVPTACPSNFMIAVSNVNINGNLLGGYGATQIDLAAPGTNIHSTIPGHNYGSKTGTSMATPHVTGVVGAMYSAMCSYDMATVYSNPDSMALVVSNYLLQAVDTVNNLQGKNKTSGRLNMLKALQMVQQNHCMIYEKQTFADDCGNCEGEVLFQVTGDFSPYTIQFSDTTISIGDTLFKGLCEGEYSVAITDSNGNVYNDTFLLEGNDSLSLTYIVGPATDPTSGDGSVSISVSGGTPQYFYLWNTGETSAILSNVNQGNYSVTVTDSNECITADTFYLYTVGINELKDKELFTIAPNPNNGSFTMTIENSNAPIQLIIYDVIGKVVYQKEFFAVNSEITIQSNLQKGVYFIKVNDMDSKVIVVQ